MRVSKMPIPTGSGYPFLISIFYLLRVLSADTRGYGFFWHPYVWPCFFIIKQNISSFITPLSFKEANKNIFLSNYLEQGSPSQWRLTSCSHFCLTDDSPIKKRGKKTKKWWTQKSQINFGCNIIQRSLFQNTITSFWVFYYPHLLSYP